MKRLTFPALLSLAAFSTAACKTIPLGGDPTQPEQQRAAPGHLYDVEWWTTLVKPGLLEFLPSEPAAPAIDADTDSVIVCTRDGMVRSLSPATGKQQWEYKTFGRCFAGPTIAEGVVYVPGGDGTLYALRSANGSLLWSYKALEDLVTSPVLAGGKLLMMSGNDTLFAVDAQSGKWLWQHRRDPPSGFTIRGASTPLVHEDTVYVGFSDGYVVAVSLGDGVARWEKNLSPSGGQQFIDADASPVLDARGNRIYVASYKVGVYALSTATGNIEWLAAQPGVTTLLGDGDKLLATGGDKVVALNKAGGQVLWSIDLSADGQSAMAGQAPLLTPSHLLVPTSKALVFIDPRSGQIATSWNPGKGVTATPTRVGQRLYVLSNLGTVFALRLTGNNG